MRERSGEGLRSSKAGKEPGKRRKVNWEKDEPQIYLEGAPGSMTQGHRVLETGKNPALAVRTDCR